MNASYRRYLAERPDVAIIDAFMPKSSRSSLMEQYWAAEERGFLVYPKGTVAKKTGQCLRRAWSVRAERLKVPEVIVGVSVYRIEGHVDMITAPCNLRSFLPETEKRKLYPDSKDSVVQAHLALRNEVERRGWKMLHPWIHSGSVLTLRGPNNNPRSALEMGEFLFVLATMGGIFAATEVGVEALVNYLRTK